jgi:hypothetical protein
VAFLKSESFRLAPRRLAEDRSASSRLTPQRSHPGHCPSLIADKAKYPTGLVTNSGQSRFDRQELLPTATAVPRQGSVFHGHFRYDYFIGFVNPMI